MEIGTYCELKAEVGGLKFHENIEPEINEWPHNWPKGEITYRLNNNSKDLDEGHQRRAVTVALRAWQIRINDLKFRRERSPNGKVDFEVSFQPSSVFNSKHVLAHAWFPGQGEVSGDCEINDEDWNWASNVHDSSMGRPPLTTVLIHEFGHSLGLRHDTNSDMESIMYPSIDTGKPKIRLGYRDIVRIQSRYGARTMSKRLLDYFALRRALGYDFR